VRNFKQTAAWCVFDLANACYSTLIITVAYAVYFRDVVVNSHGNRGDSLWGIANFIAMGCVALASPIVGALADFSGKKKAYLVVSSLTTVAATVLMYYIGPGDIARGMAVYVVGTFAYQVGYVFYNSFLHEVSTPETVGRVSGWGWGLAYIGGLVCLLATQPMLKQPFRAADGQLIPSGVAAYQTAFLVVAAFCLVFALPAYLLLPGAGTKAQSAGWGELITIGFKRTLETLKHLKHYKETAKFIVASAFFTDGITTVIGFAAIYATTTMGFTGEQVVYLFIGLQIVALPGALVAGYLADKIGAKPTILITLVLWLVVVVMVAASPDKTVFLVAAAGAAIGMGATQSVGRSFMVQLTPPSKQAEFFGFYALSGKFASMLGPMIFGTVSNWSGSQRYAVLSLLPLFLVGIGFMWVIDAVKGRQAALEGA
jgi:MFS transporter, UMF1 family